MPITREIRSPGRPTNYDLTQLSADEHLFLWRHRQRSKNRPETTMSQPEAAEALGLTPSMYNSLEAGGRVVLGLENIAALMPMTVRLAPTTGELCFLARRRSGRTLNVIEQEIGLTRPSYHAQERAGADRIVSYWVGKGFRFPDANRETAAA